MVNATLHALIVEDSENDALLLELELQRSGYDPLCQRVETREALAAALEHQKWDLVIADYKMPHFDGLEALALVKAKGLDLPFIIVSGLITDKTAVAAMKAGAHDYVMKDNLARLGPAVQRELREAEMRRDRRRADEKLKVEQVFRRAIEQSVPAGIAVVDLEGHQTYVNPAFCALVGWSEPDLVGARAPFAYWPPGEVETINRALESVVRGQAPAGGMELVFCRRTGERVNVLMQVTPLKDSFSNVTGWVSAVSDITERKRAEKRLAAEHAITRLLAGAPSLQAAAPAILQVLVESLEVDFGALWEAPSALATAPPSPMHLAAVCPPLASFQAASSRLAFAVDSGLPERVRREGQGLWLPDMSLDPAIRRPELAAQAELVSAAAFPIQSGGHCLGVLEFFAEHRLEFDPTLNNMMTAIGSEIAQFLQRRHAEDALRLAHDQLEIRVQERTAELQATNSKLHAVMAERQRLESELLEITERERRRIGLDLHDDLGQKLSGIALMTKGLELKLTRQQADGAQDAGKIHTLVQEAMDHASNLAHDLATLDLKEQDLPMALEGLAAHAREVFGIACRFSAEGPIPPLDLNRVTQLYKIAQEAVTNAVKHGKAKRVNLSLAHAAGKLVLTIQNTGLPFPDLRSESTGMGLRIMNYRANLIGGSLDIKAAGSKGTIVTCVLPV